MDLSDNNWRASAINVPLLQSMNIEEHTQKAINAIMLLSQNFVIKCMNQKITICLVINTPA